jgi:flagellar motor switch protein FliG
MDRIRNAAIILIGLGEQCAGEILKNMNPREVRAILDAINNIETVSDEDVSNALNNFYKDSSNVLGLDVSSKDKLKNTIMMSVGSKGMGDFISGVNLDNEEWLNLLEKQDASIVAEIIQDEHPQIITALMIIVFNYLSSDHGTKIIRHLEPEFKNMIFRRMTKMGFISQTGLDLMSDFFTKELQEADKNHIIPLDGIDAVASIISCLDSETETQIMTDISTHSSDLTEQIQEKIFPFHRLTELDKKSMQVLLREVNNEDLILALKGVDDNIKKAFMDNMSQKSADILRDEMETKGPVKLSTVVDAQKRIIRIAKKLESEEKIIMSSKNNPGIVY